MSHGIIDAFRQRCAAHNRANRRSTEAALPLETPSRVLSAVRALANIPIMHRRSVAAKRSLIHSASTDASRVTDFWRRRFAAHERLLLRPKTGKNRNLPFVPALFWISRPSPDHEDLLENGL